MIGPRMTELLRASATVLRGGEAPLSHEFLVEHEVTLDEAYDLADLLAAGVDVLLEVAQTPAGQRLFVTAVTTAALTNPPKEN